MSRHAYPCKKWYFEEKLFDAPSANTSLRRWVAISNPRTQGFPQLRRPKRNSEQIKWRVWKREWNKGKEWIKKSDWTLSPLGQQWTIHSQISELNYETTGTRLWICPLNGSSRSFHISRPVGAHNAVNDWGCTFFHFSSAELSTLTRTANSNLSWKCAIVAIVQTQKRSKV